MSVLAIDIGNSRIGLNVFQDGKAANPLNASLEPVSTLKSNRPLPRSGPPPRDKAKPLTMMTPASSSPPSSPTLLHKSNKPSSASPASAPSSSAAIFLYP